MSSQGGRKTVRAKTPVPRISEPSPCLPTSEIRLEARSAGNTPVSSPVISRKVLSKSANDVDNTTLIDVLELSQSVKTGINETLPPAGSNETPKCPCTTPPPKNSVNIKCSSCSRQWHSTCVNLSGITAGAVKKLTWKCPKCYISPFAENMCKTNDIDSFAQFKNIVTNIKEVNEDLKGSSNSIEFFNAHLKHLLLNPSDFIKHSERLTAVEEGIAEIKSTLADMVNVDIVGLKEEVGKIGNQLFSQQSGDGDESISIEINALKELVTELTSRPTTSISPELNESITKVSTFPIDDILKIGENVNELSDKIAQMQSSYICPNSTPAPIMPSNQTPDKILPNTTSPHHKTKIEHICDPFTSYKEDVITQDLKEELTGLVDRMKDSFTTIGTENTRDVLYFGEYGYRYSGGEHSAKPLPEEVKNLIASVRPNLPSPEMDINSCLVSRYITGANSIPDHRDNEPLIDPESDIITISIGAERQMTFTNNNGTDVRHQTLKDCSMLASSRFSQDFWLHKIGPCDSATVRYSFTLRHIDPRFINSTVILGDSNTLNVKFGSGVGTLGSWMPGKRVKVGHIEAIPDAVDIGPYRNFVIHTGINSINSSPRFRKSNKLLIDTLESKICNICETYPHSKVFVSLLLPSRSVPLNYRIRDFNNSLLDMTCKFNRVSVIEHSLFGVSLSNDHGRWKPSIEGSTEYVPKVEDILHLGKVGLRLLAKTIKQAVIGKSRPQSRERFDGGRGGYRRAAERNLSHQRGGSNANRFSPLADHNGDET